MEILSQIIRDPQKHKNSFMIFGYVGNLRLRLSQSFGGSNNKSNFQEIVNQKS